MVRVSVLSLVLLARLFAASIGDLDAGYHDMYNLQFDDAHHRFAEWKQTHPGDPMGTVSNAAAYLFSELDRLHTLQSEFFVDNDRFLSQGKLKPDPKVKQAFLAELNRATAEADRTLAQNPGDENATFAKLLALGLRADYLGLIEKRYLASLSSIKAGRQLAQQLLAAHPDCYDAYLAIGVENYLLSLKPAPVRWMLRLGGAQTDRSVGLANLRLTAEKGRYLLPYARLLLAVAALRDNNRDKARQILQDLAREFPRNPLYAAELARLH